MSAQATPGARQDWEQRIGRRSDRPAVSPAVELRPPTDVSAEAGVGHITLTWEAVDGAGGYVINRADRRDGRFVALNHGGSDVLAVPAPPYVDTDVLANHTYAYTVGSVAQGGRGATVSAAVEAVPRAGTAEPVDVHVDATRTTGALHRVWSMVGAERLSLLEHGPDQFGNDVGDDVLRALAIARDELGVRQVRAHAILHDDLAVFSWDGAGPSFRFDRVDRIFDALVGLGLRPIVELSFMPHDLARDPGSTVFGYRGIVSPPRDWAVWAELNGRLAAHVVERYGADEVSGWGFEVWNEPNLEVFWAGTQAEYFRLYAEAAQAIKAVEPRLRVGGPATAAVEWLEDFVAFVSDAGLPLDFLSTHTYGNIPLDARPILRRHGRDDSLIWWTEWGIGSGHSDPIHGTAFDAPFLLRGYKAVQGRVDALAHWVVSDHFEELGWPQRLFHNGFGLLTVGNLRKPRFWAQRMASELGDEVLAVQLRGDGAGGLIDAWATRASDGRVDLLVWNGTPNAAEHRGNPVLERTVRLRVAGLGNRTYHARLALIDEQHSNIARAFPADLLWPDPDQWKELRAHDHLAERPVDDLVIRAGSAELELQLPMPGVARLRLEPANPNETTTTEGRIQR
ncbi:MAG: xylan 1,4-beta-xylosidase [Candidatus Dormibacter sp.]